jgi:hypothetical protein
MGGMSEFSMMLKDYNISLQMGYFLFALAMIVIGWLMWMFIKKYIGGGNGQEKYT